MSILLDHPSGPGSAVSKLTPAQEDAADRAERLMSMSKAAALLGRDRNTLAAWAAKGMPIARKGETGSSHLVDLKDVVAWREEQVRREEQARFPSGGGEDLAGGGVRMSPADMLKMEQLKLTRLKVGQTAEILIPRALAEAAFQRSLGLVRQAVMAVPERIARDMSGFPEDRVLAWRVKAKDHCASALTEGAKAIREIMPDFEVPPAS